MSIGLLSAEGFDSHCPSFCDGLGTHSPWKSNDSIDERVQGPRQVFCRAIACTIRSL